MSVSIDDLLNYTEDHMNKAIKVMNDDFAAIRTGKASPALVDSILVDYYGTPTKLKELAGITTPEAKLIVIQPWDPSCVPLIEKAILGSNLGISPVSDGKVLRLPMPDLSEERRKALAKQVKTRAEDTKIAIRNIRRDSNDVAKKAKKDSVITEDDLSDMLDDIQKLTNDYIKKVDVIVKEKEQELLKL
jgi:ribosome recycling factor